MTAQHRPTLPSPTATHVALIGMMGSGKSSVGVLLAQRLELPFCDTDTLVEAAAGSSIAALVQQDGEAALRAHERDALTQALAQPPQIIATGGGIIIDPTNRAALRQHASVHYLRATPALLMQRIGADTASRPLLAPTAQETSDRLTALLAQRRQWYEQTAHHIIELRQEQSVEEVVREIEARLG